MSEAERADEGTLTGVWDGAFRQPVVGSINFTATLIESGQHITGSTHEPCACAHYGCPRETHLAILTGHRQGRGVSFVKTYDPAGFGYDTVMYSGELNDDATEIAGRWSIRGGFSGEFVMMRARRKAAVRERKKLATVSS